MEDKALIAAITFLKKQKKRKKGDKETQDDKGTFAKGKK